MQIFLIVFLVALTASFICSIFLKEDIWWNYGIGKFQIEWVIEPEVFQFGLWWDWDFSAVYTHFGPIAFSYVLMETVEQERVKDVKLGRELFRKAFIDDPDFRRTYVDNVSCVLMDELWGYEGDKEKRDKVADKIIKHILE